MTRFRRWDMGPTPINGAALPWVAGSYPGTQFALMFDRRWEYLATFERLYGIPEGADPDGTDTAERILAGEYLTPLMRSAGYLPFTSTDGIRIALESVVRRSPITDSDRWVWFREGMWRWLEDPTENVTSVVRDLALRITDYAPCSEQEYIYLQEQMMGYITKKSWKKAIANEIRELDKSHR